MITLTLKSVLAVPVIMAIAGGSVVLISKVGGKAAGKKIRYLHGLDEGFREGDDQQ